MAILSREEVARSSAERQQVQHHQQNQEYAAGKPCDEDDEVTVVDEHREASTSWSRLCHGVLNNDFVIAHVLTHLRLAEMLRAASIRRCFLEALCRVEEVKMTCRCLCMPSLMSRFRGARCLTLEGGIDLFNAMGLLAWPLQTSLGQVCQLNFEISGDEIGDDARGFHAWERGLTTLARSGALRDMSYLTFSFRGRLKGVAHYLTHAAFEAVFLVERPRRLLSLECALLVAAGHPEIDATIAVELLRRHADPNALTPRGTPALLLAAESNNRDVVRALLGAGADATSRSAVLGNKSALHCAVANTYWYSFRDDRDDARIVVYSTPLLEKRKRPAAVRFERAAIVDLLVVAGVDVNARDELGNTPLITAVASCGGDLDWDAKSVICTVHALLSAGADVTLKNKAGYTALDSAVELDKPIELLSTLAEAEVAACARGSGSGAASPSLLLPPDLKRARFARDTSHFFS